METDKQQAQEGGPKFGRILAVFCFLFEFDSCFS